MEGAVDGPGSRRARVVADLSLPEALVIWALRKQHQARTDQGADDGVEPARSSERPETVDPGHLKATFTRVFGCAKVEEAMAIFLCLTRDFEQGARCRIRINDYAEECLSIHEEHFLSILAAFQQAELERAAMLIQWLIGRSANRNFTQHAHTFARLLLSAGHNLTGAAMRASLEAGAQKSQSGAARGEAAVPPVGQLEELTLGEAIIVRGMRRWVACLHQEQEPFPVLHAHFLHYGINDSAASLNAVLRNIAFAARRPVDIRGPACPDISPDETSLLRAVAGLQRQDGEPAYDALASWLPVTAIRLSTGALSGLADSLLDAGLVLPLREPSDTGGSQSQHARAWRFGDAGVRSRTLH